MRAWQSIGGFHPHHWTESLHLMQFKHLFWKRKGVTLFSGVAPLDKSGMFSFSTNCPLQTRWKSVCQRAIVVVPWGCGICIWLFSYCPAKYLTRPPGCYEHPDIQLATHETTEDLDETPEILKRQNYPSTVSGGFLWTHKSPTLSPLEEARAVSLSLQVPP